MIVKMRRNMANNHGSAFIIVLLLVLIMSVLGISMLGLAASNIQMGDVDRDYQSVFYIAESGRDYEVEGLSEVAQQKSEDVEDSDAFFTAMDEYFEANYPKTITVFDEQFGETITATVDIEGIGTWEAGSESHTYTLVSEGNIGGVRRMVSSGIDMDWTENDDSTNFFDSDVALFSMSTIDMTGSAAIIGPAGTNTTQADGVRFTWSTYVTGDMYVSPDADPDVIFDIPNHDSLDGHFEDLIVMPEEREYPLPDYPEIPSLPHKSDMVLAWNYHDITIDEDGERDLIKTNSYTLNIDVGDGVRELVVEDFVINGSGRVNIIGSGTLKLYVTDEFDLNGSSTFNAGGDPSQVILYYSGSDDFQVDGATQFVGSVYVESADLNIVGSGGITGHIISGGTDVDITGNASAHVRVIYAPNAYVRLSGSGHVSGAVIAKKCVMTGGTSITYDQNADLGEMPGIVGGSSGGEVDVSVDRAVEQDY